MIEFKEPRDVKLRHVQTRNEKHGDTDKLAIDLSIAVNGSNKLLDMIHPDLRAALFKPLTEQEGELSLPVDDLPSIRFSLLQPPLKYDREQAGMTARISYGVSGKADVVLGGVKLSKVKVAQWIEGGSVTLHFNLSTTDVSEKTIGKLSILLGHEISLTLTQPEAADEPKDAGHDPAPAWPFPNDGPENVKEGTKPKPLTAEDVFIGNEAPAE